MRTVFLFGSGAVKDSWDPILKALKGKYIPNSLGEEITEESCFSESDMANLVMARLVYEARLTAQGKLKRSCSFEKRQAYNESRARIDNLSERIREELQKAQKLGKIQPQNGFISIFQKAVLDELKGGQLAVISANWDTVIDEKIKQYLDSPQHPGPEVFHIHGSIYESDLPLYLPTEIAWESYRTETVVNRYLKRHKSTLGSIKSAGRIVIYGLSLSPLDAELITILADGLKRDNEGKTEVIIIDPKHQEVEIRLKLMLEDSSKIEIKGSHQMEWYSSNS